MEKIHILRKKGVQYTLNRNQGTNCGKYMKVIALFDLRIRKEKKKKENFTLCQLLTNFFLVASITKKKKKKKNTIHHQNQNQNRSSKKQGRIPARNPR